MEFLTKRILVNRYNRLINHRIPDQTLFDWTSVIVSLSVFDLVSTWRE